jgi:hypothetical protein
MSTNKTILAAAALTGLLSAGVMNAHAYSTNDATQAQAGDQKSIEKHACKGQNSCKGNGGGDKAHYGKNTCKGKGSCATDGNK